MKTTRIATTALICLLISATMVLATNTATVTMTPSGWARSSAQSVSLSVTNNGPDAITTIVLQVPKDANQVPLYVVDPEGITTPQGWGASTTGSTINKITWVATGSGIASGSSLNLFGLVATSPSASGNYQWSWTAGTATGTITTTVGTASLAYFVITNVPMSSNAGNTFTVNVMAFGADNQVKTDYTGTVSFSSTDANAVLPSSYTFQSADGGSKNFAITYKTSGTESFTVTDSATGISKASSNTVVNLGQAAYVQVTPQGKEVSVGDTVAFTVLAYDSFGNALDVTSKSTFANNAGGTWNKNVFTAEKEGTWIVIATYKSLPGGATLVVSQGAVTTPTPVSNITNVTVTQPINITTTPQGQGAVSLATPKTVTIAPGSNDTMIVTVNNNGNQGLTGVQINTQGVPSDWVSVYPMTNDVPVNSSKDYLVIVTVPANGSGSRTIEFMASSNQGVIVYGNTTLVISGSPTGTFALPKNVLQLGVVIIAVAAVVIIGWELWFKKPKSK